MRSILTSLVLGSALAMPLVGQPQQGGLTSPDGKAEVTCPLPASEKKRNVGGRDGAGLCVFTSIEYAARWQNERRLFDLQQNMRKEPGGGYPEKVDQMLKKYGNGAPYMQSTSSDMALLKAALDSGRMPAITYAGMDSHYHGQRVSHMTDLIYLDDKWAAITDNNFPGDDQIMWMSVEDFKKRFTSYGGGWCVILLSPPPPPPPHN